MRKFETMCDYEILPSYRQRLKSQYNNNVIRDAILQGLELTDECYEDVNDQPQTNVIDISMEKFNLINGNEILLEHEPKIVGYPAHAKIYPDGIVTGLNVIMPVKVATTRDITCAGILLDIDGVMVNHRDRVLVKNQDDPSTNGVYVVNGFGDWWWAADYNSSGSIPSGCFTFVEQGELQANTGWVLMNDVITGRSPSMWAQFSATPQVGSGLSSFS